MKQPWMLMILDGWGLAPAGPGNAVAAAKTPCLDAAFARYPHAQLECSGLAVGLPEGQMGNSEVGHTNIGAISLKIPPCWPPLTMPPATVGRSICAAC